MMEGAVTGKLRSIRDKVSRDIMDMNHEQIKEYLRNEKTLHAALIWKKTN